MQRRKKSSSAKAPQPSSAYLVQPAASQPKTEAGPSMSGDSGGSTAMSGDTAIGTESERCQSPTFQRILREVSAADPDRLLRMRSSGNKREESAIADRILSFTERLYELEDNLNEMIVERRNLKNEVLTLQDENMQLQLALNRERKKVERAWNQLDESARPRDMSPPRPPPRSYQQNRSRTQHPPPPPPAPFRFGDPPASRSYGFCPCVMPWNLNENDILDTEDMTEDDLAPYLAHRYIAPVDRLLQRYNALSSSAVHAGHNPGPQGASGPSRPPRILGLTQARRQQIVQHEQHNHVQLQLQRQQHPQQQQPQRQQQPQQPQRPQRHRRQPPAAHQHSCMREGNEEGSHHLHAETQTRVSRGPGRYPAAAANRPGTRMFALNDRPLDYEPLPLD